MAEISLLPSPKVGWVTPPNGRGTIDIVWGCLLVLFTAVYNVIHLNLPADNDGFWTILLRKLRWVFMAILAPDLVTLHAASQWESARVSVANMHALGHKHWTLTHAFYADSGGFRLRSADMWPFPISAASILYLVEKNCIPPPSLTQEEIWDKSKSDKFAKGAALLQTGWIVISCIAHTSQQLPLCSLELFTLEFVISTLTTYFFWLHKPQSARTASILVLPTSTAKLLCDAGSAADKPYHDTPLDFVEKRRLPWKRRQCLEKFDLRDRPLMRFPDDSQIP